MKGIVPALVLGLGLGLGLFAAIPAQAQSKPELEHQTGAAAGAVSRRVSMGIGKSIIVDLPSDASEIFIGNPKVANAVVRSARKLYVIGMENGPNDRLCSGP